MLCMLQAPIKKGTCWALFSMFTHVSLSTRLMFCFTFCVPCFAIAVVCHCVYLCSTIVVSVVCVLLLFLYIFASFLLYSFPLDDDRSWIPINTHKHTHTSRTNKQTQKKTSNCSIFKCTSEKSDSSKKKYPRKKEKAKVKLRRTYKLKRVIIALVEDGYSLSHFSCRSVDQLIVYSVCICVYL